MAVLKVGVRDLRQKLSHYIEMAQAGQTIAITEHGKVIARLGPAEIDLDGRLAALQEAGIIRWRGRKLATVEPVAQLRGPKQVADLVTEMRE